MPEQWDIGDTVGQRFEDFCAPERGKVENPQLVALANDGKTLRLAVQVKVGGAGKFVLAGACGLGSDNQGCERKRPDGSSLAR